MSLVPPVPLHVSLGDWDGIVLLIGCFGPFLVVAALVIYLRITGEDEDEQTSSES